MNKYENLRLENQIVFPLYLCSKELIRRYTVYLNEIDLTYTQYIVMTFFWEKGSSNVKDLGKIMLLDSSTLTPLLKKLESKGYITRERNKEDERNLVLSLTKKGEDLKEQAVLINAKMKKDLNIKKEDEESFVKSLMNILKYLIEEEEK
jgi:DNA-binding MarR family transcriptional regulator